VCNVFLVCEPLRGWRHVMGLWHTFRDALIGRYVADMVLCVQRPP
jgi:hypothetical protein